MKTSSTRNGYSDYWQKMNQVAQEATAAVKAQKSPSRMARVLLPLVHRALLLLDTRKMMTTMTIDHREKRLHGTNK